MHDDIQTRLTDLGRAAEQAAAPVGFEGIRRRARRRRAHTVSTAVLCVLAAAGAGVGIGQATSAHRLLGPVHHGSQTPQPSPTPPVRTPTPRIDSARRIAENPHSFVLASTVFPGDADQAATLWELGPADPKAQVAMTTTVDGYAHVRYVPLPKRHAGSCTDVRAIGNDEFWLGCDTQAFLVHGDGTVQVASTSRTSNRVPHDAVLVSAPLIRIEVGSEWFDAGGLLHHVPAPVSVWLVHAPDGRIWGLTGSTNKLYWSTDGGRTWSHRALPRVPAGGTEGYALVKTALPGTMVVAHGSEQTMFHPDSLLVYGHNGALEQQVAVHAGLMDSAMVTPDGSLVMELYNEPNGSSGIFRGAPAHWADLHKVLDLPANAAGRPAGSLWMGSSVNTSGKPSLWAVFTSGVLATSTDDGRTWSTRSIR